MTIKIEKFDQRYFVTLVKETTGYSLQIFSCKGRSTAVAYAIIAQRFFPGALIDGVSIKQFFPPIDRILNFATLVSSK